MTDYLTPEYRATMREDYAEFGCVTSKDGMQLLDHAAEADRRLAERDRVIELLADALRTLNHATFTVPLEGEHRESLLGASRNARAALAEAAKLTGGAS